MNDYKNSIIILTLTGLSLLNSSRAVTMASAESLVARSDIGTASGVEIDPTSRQLAALSAEISARSDVRIVVSTDLAKEEVDVELDATDWNGTIRGLLRNYDYLAILDRDGSYRRVWITARDKNRITGEGISPRASFGVRTAVGHDEPDPLTELPIAIWQPIDVGGTSVFDESDIPHKSVQMDPDFFDLLEVGRPVEIPIPQESQPYYGVVGEIHNQLNGAVQVWSGPIDGAHDTASFTMTRGRVSTYVTIATGSAIYEAVLDNATGVGSVMNEVDLTKGKDEHDSLIPRNPDSKRE